MPAFVDIADEDEDRRIEMIGHQVMAHKRVVSFITDDEKDKAERYIRKLEEKFPGIRVIERGRGPVDKTVWVKVGPPLN
ncbi:MAG: hypothetical protein WBA09_22505 [Candidatus Acidiferrum sp.]